MRGHCWKIGGEWDGKTYVDRKELNGWPEPHAMFTRQLWAAWRDRAALAKYDAQPVQQARQPLTDAQIEKLREKTFSTTNPFCPCDSKTMRKAVRAAERAHGITGEQP